MKSAWLIRCVVVLPFLNSVALLSAEPVLEVLPGVKETDAKFVVRGLPDSVLGPPKLTDEAWQELLAIYTVIDGRVAPTAILGEYTFANGQLTFEPRYPLRRAVTYRAILRWPNGNSKGKELTRDFTPTPENPAPPTRLTAIYPTREQVPENLLKFYFHFSAPMSRGEVYSRVRLRDQQGKIVEAPFLELGEELWSPDGMRLTLYFDPGRIKRGLQPRELFGPALLEGHRYTLELDPNWPDATGRALTSTENPIKKTLQVGAPDDQQPDVKRWKVVSPVAGSREPLAILFDEPLDSAMLVRVLQVRNAAGNAIGGNVELGKSEMNWLFRPARNWAPGKYSIEVAAALEDLAGNSLGRPFEVDVFRPLPKPSPSDTVRVPFVIEQSAGS